MKYLAEWKLWPFVERILTITVGAFLMCVAAKLEGGTLITEVNWWECASAAIAAGLPLGATWDFLKFRDYKMEKE